MKTSKLKPGEIYWAKNIPTVNRYGVTCYKNRPVVVITNKLGLEKSGIVSVIPLSSHVEKMGKTHCNVLVGDLLPKRSATMTEQISTISQEQLLGEPVEQLNADVFGLVKDALSRQLGIST